MMITNQTAEPRIVQETNCDKGACGQEPRAFFACIGQVDCRALGVCIMGLIWRMTPPSIHRCTKFIMRIPAQLSATMSMTVALFKLLQDTFTCVGNNVGNYVTGS